MQADSIYNSYAFEINQEKESHGFSNLIIEEFEQGYLGFIVNYESETIFNGMSSFIGKVNRTTLNGELLAEMYFENGKFLSPTTTTDSNGKVLLTGLCLTDVEVTKECTPSKELSTATGTPNEHIQECVTVTTYTYEYCSIPDPWGNYIIGGLGNGPIGTGTVGGVPTSGGGTSSSGSPTYSDDSNAGNNIVPIVDPSKPKNVPVIEPDGWPGLEDGFPNEWWLNKKWLDANFSLDVDENYDRLIAEEKILIKMYPLQAYLISKNAEKAQLETINQFSRNGLNDKSDAFRHAYFQALNTQSVGAEITKLFSNAHESETPPLLNLEKQMDLFNNQVGINYADTYSTICSCNSLSLAIVEALLKGELQYLSPLDFVASPIYDANGDQTQDCSTCLNGMTALTTLRPTNQ